MFQIPNPNFTQTPNVLFDDIAKTLKEGELRVLLVIMRQTFGWHKQWDRISLSQLERKTGMCRDAVVNSLKSLISMGLIDKKKSGNPGQEKCWYQLVVEESENNDILPDDGDESIEDSNNFDQSSKTTPTSRLKRPTKETTLKETISPIVPKGDISRRKSKREEKLERTSGVWTTPAQDADLQKRCAARGITVEQCYDRLSTWKIGKEIEGGKNDYQSLVNWVIDAVVKNPKSPSNQNKNLELAQKVMERLPRQVQQNEIQLQEKGLLFTYGHVIDFIEFEKFGFRDKLISRLQKMNQSVEGL